MQAYITYERVNNMWFVYGYTIDGALVAANRDGIYSIAERAVIGRLWELGFNTIVAPPKALRADTTIAGAIA